MFPSVSLPLAAEIPTNLHTRTQKRVGFSNAQGRFKKYSQLFFFFIIYWFRAFTVLSLSLHTLPASQYT
jgi:hypothetical protein